MGNKKNTGAAAVQRRNHWILAGLAAVLAVLFFVSLGTGRYSIAFADTLRIVKSVFVPTEKTWTPIMETMVLNVRLPRIVAAVMVGAALSVSGAIYQSIFRNPLVSPDMLGVSSGACVGAAAGILLHLSGLEIQLMALCGGLAAVCIAVTIPKLFKNKSTLILVLSGVLISGFMGSIVSMIKYLADPENELADIVYWTMGSFSSARWEDVTRYGPAIAAVLIVPFLLRWRLNIMSLGEKEAFFLGVNVRRTRAIFIFCATILTSTAICICGTIGYVGLIIPHFCRLLSGADNRTVVPASILAGGIFMLLVDTLARSVSASEIPLSIFTGVFGVPLFIVLLLAQKTRLE